MLKLALLGCGDVAQRDYLPEFHRLSERAEIVAVCGRTPERVAAVAARYQIPNIYSDYRKMLVQSDAEAVINLTPIQLHDEINAAIVASGRHLYTEKPAANHLANGQALRDLARQQAVKVVCAPCSPIFPQVRHVRSLIEAGMIGEIYSARAIAHFGVPPWAGYASDPSPFFAKGAGVLVDMGVYPLHTLTALLGPVRQVMAISAHVLESFAVAEGPFAGKQVPVEVEDHWQIILDFGEKQLATLAANNLVVDTRTPSVEIHGLKGTIALDPIDVGAPIELLRSGKGWEHIHLPPTGRASGPDHHLGLEHLVDCIQLDLQPTLSLDHALHVVEIIEKAEQSARTGRVMPINSEINSFRV
jgi:predicted dehydrogenase